MSKKTDQTLNKCNELIDRLNELKKALTATNVSSNRKPVGALGVGWSQDPSTGAFHHSTYGIISTHKLPEGGFEIRHGGGIVGRVKDIADAGAHIKNYVSGLGSMDTGMFNRPSVQTAATMNDPKLGRAKVPAAGVTYTPAQMAAMQEAKKIKKSVESASWIQHKSVPNADEEVMKVQRENPAVAGEKHLANQLANMMMSKAMLNPNHRQPTSEDMVMAGEAMGIAPSQEMIKSAEQQWAGTMNNWLAEAQKPISARFSSPEEEQAYWDSIKVTGKKDDDYGF